MKDKMANIMLLGKTGVGKSTFINYFLGKDVCETGCGEPVTQNFNMYEEKVNGFDIRIFDSKGLEVQKSAEMKNSIVQYISQKCNSDDIYDWIHTIFYCVNSASARFEPAEKNFLNELKEKISQNIHIILTHCEDVATNEKIKEMRDYIKKELGQNVNVYCVNSVREEHRDGTVSEQFGKEEIVQKVFELLWDDMAHKISKQYANELWNGIVGILINIQSETNYMIDQITPLKLIKDAANNGDYLDNLMDVTTNKLDPEIDRMVEELSQKYQEKIECLVQLYNNYSGALKNNSHIDLYDISDFMGSELFDIDFDDILERTKLGKFMHGLENMNEDNIFDVIGAAAKGVVGILGIQKMLREAFNALFQEMYRSIPAKNELENNIYNLIKL